MLVGLIVCWVIEANQESFEMKRAVREQIRREKNEYIVSTHRKQHISAERMRNISCPMATKKSVRMRTNGYMNKSNTAR